MLVESLSIVVGLGVIIGFVASFLGIGGGAIMVPVLMMVFSQTPLKAIIAISLGVIFFNSGLNGYSFYQKRGSASFNLSKKFILGTIPGSVLGSALLFYIPEKNVKILFAFFLLMQAFKLLYRAYRKDEIIAKVKELNYPLIGFIGGVISSLTGLGGGAVFVPLIKSSTNIATKDISMISNHIMVLATFTGLLPLLGTKMTSQLPFPHFEWGVVNFFVIGLIILGTFSTRPLGMRLNDRISDQKKSLILAVVFFLLALKILIKELL